MIKNMKDAERDAAFRVADAMCAAAHTAPKANGLDKIRTLIISGEDIEPLAKEMEVAGKEYGLEFFCRDADNIRNSHCVVLIAAMGTASGVPHCAMCGFENCVMYSIGRSALRLKLFADNVKLCYGIPLSTGAKSNYFDRAPGSVLL